MSGLVLQHVPYGGPGYIADYMRERGLGFDVLRLWQPYTLPDISRYSALIVMGGPFAVYDDFPSRNDEVAPITQRSEECQRSGSVSAASSSPMPSVPASTPTCGAASS